MDTIQYITENKIIAIMRGVETDRILDTAWALYEGGIRLVEVTFNQRGDFNETGEKIKILCENFEGKMCIGAGSVMTMDQLMIAYSAGAKYIISPDSKFEIIKKTKELGLISMPGAFTPTEIAYAFELGADIVKLFPAGVLGTGYIKAIKAPINHIPLAAVGGVNLKNILDFMEAGIDCFGIGSDMVNLVLVQKGKYDEISKIAAAYVEMIKMNHK